MTHSEKNIIKAKIIGTLLSNILHSFICFENHSLLLLFLLLFSWPTINLPLCWLLSFSLLQLAHAQYLFLIFLSFRIHQRCSRLRNLGLLNFICCLLYCKLVLYFLAWLLCCFTLLNKFVSKSVSCWSCQLFYVLDTIVFCSKHWSVHTFWSHCDLFTSKYQVVSSNQFFVTFQSKIKIKSTSPQR